MGYEGYYESQGDLDAGDVCGVHHGLAEVVQLAIDGKAEELEHFPAELLDDAMKAISFCSEIGCRAHGGDRDAYRLLDAAWTAAITEDVPEESGTFEIGEVGP
jgi:hypothetical protein